MMTLPPGFDVSLLVNDFQACAMPFVTVALLFAAAYLIKKSIGGVH